MTCAASSVLIWSTTIQDSTYVHTYFKTTAVDVTLVLEEETEGPILDSQTDLTLPEATNLEVGGSHD
jgi:hypothetical protein